LSITEYSTDCLKNTTRLLARSFVRQTSLTTWERFSAGSCRCDWLRQRCSTSCGVSCRPCPPSSLVACIPPMHAALPWHRHPDPTADLLHWNVHIQLMHDPCPPYHHPWMSPTASPSCLFCVSDRDKACTRWMIEVTLVR